MITAETTLRNIKIADFVNTEKYKDSGYWQIPEHISQLFKFGLVPKTKPEMLLFDMSWDWLMSVCILLNIIPQSLNILEVHIQVANEIEKRALEMDS